jgi:hypothetical protein
LRKILHLIAKNPQCISFLDEKIQNFSWDNHAPAIGADFLGAMGA